MISEEEVNQVKVDVTKYGNEWRKRKRACMDIIDTICESADLNRKEFIVRLQQFNSDLQKKLGIDLDEDYKIDINEVLTM